MNRKRIKYAFSIVSIVAFIALLLSGPVLLQSVYWVSVLIVVAINILLVASLRTISLIGHFSLGHVGFMLIGAYGSALLVMRAGLSFWTALIIAGLLSAAVALVLGYPFLRVRGIYFAILTLLTGETLRLTAWYWESVTGGPVGLLNIPSPSPIAIPGAGIITFESANSYYYLTLVIVALSLFLLYRLEHSQVGFKWRAIREADGLAQSVGINVIWLKILNFAIACFFAGIAGALYAHYQQGLSAHPTSRFGVLMSIYLLVYLVVGGGGRFAGPIVGAFVLTMASELARPLLEYRNMLIGAIAILIVLFMPEGLVDLPNRLQLWRRSISKRLNKEIKSRSSLGGT